MPPEKIVLAGAPVEVAPETVTALDRAKTNSGHDARAVHHTVVVVGLSRAEDPTADHVAIIPEVAPADATLGARTPMKKQRL